MNTFHALHLSPSAIETRVTRGCSREYSWTSASVRSVHPFAMTKISNAPSDSEANMLSMHAAIWRSSLCASTITGQGACCLDSIMNLPGRELFVKRQEIVKCREVVAPRMRFAHSSVVVPAEAGTQCRFRCRTKESDQRRWIPAFAGMTAEQCASSTEITS